MVLATANFSLLVGLRMSEKIGYKERETFLLLFLMESAVVAPVAPINDINK